MQPSGLKFPKPTRVAKARKPLKRSYMRRKSPRRLKRAGSDPAYLVWVRRQSCALFARCTEIEGPFCEGRIHAHHAGRRPGVGMKAPDDTAIPLCEKHHRAWHDMTGIFAGLSKLERRRWSAARRAALKSERG